MRSQFVTASPHRPEPDSAHHQANLVSQHNTARVRVDVRRFERILI
jgi:hypothetical protein